MPISKNNYNRVPADLEPPLLEKLEDVCIEHNIPRTRMLRMMVKFCMDSRTRVEEVIRHGDKKPK